MILPLIFVVHNRAGRLSPALYHDDCLPREHDPIVYSLRLDTQPDWDHEADTKAGDIMFACWAIYQRGGMPPSETIPSGGKY